MARKLVMGNWKMNGDLSLCQSIAEVFGQGSVDLTTDVVFLPPMIYVPKMVELLKNTGYHVGGQDSSKYSRGAHTGDIHPSMLKELGAEFVILGHSERRADGESDSLVAEKVAQALSCDLIPVICIGETLEQREANQTLDVVKRQLAAVIELNGIDVLLGSVIAYEPVWAIGTGLAATPEQAQQVHASIRDYLKGFSAAASDIPLLYGGSVNSSNAQSLFAEQDIDGALVGGVSLKPQEFLTVCQFN